MTKKSKDVEYAAHIGLDWGGQEHAVCLQERGDQRFEKWVVKHTPEELDNWASQLCDRFRGKPVAVCLELTKGPVVSALLKHSFIDIFPVNPSTLARYRKAWFPSGAKDDPGDAKLALEVLAKHPEKLYRLRLQGEDKRALQRLVEDRRRLVEQRVRFTNRLTAALKEYFPQVLEWFEHKGTIVFCDFLQRWDTAEKARRARRNSVESFMKAHNVRRIEVVEARLEKMKCCVALTTDPGVVIPAQLAVSTFVPMLRECVEAIGRYDKAIATLEAKHDDHRIFRSFPAAADALAPSSARAKLTGRENRRDFRRGMLLSTSSQLARSMERLARLAPTVLYGSARPPALGAWPRTMFTTRVALVFLRSSLRTRSCVRFSIW